MHRSESTTQTDVVPLRQFERYLSKTICTFTNTPDRPYETEVGDRDYSHVAEFGDRDKLKRHRRQNSATATLVMSSNPATATRAKTTCGRSSPPLRRK